MLLCETSHIFGRENSVLWLPKFKEKFRCNAFEIVLCQILSIVMSGFDFKSNDSYLDQFFSRKMMQNNKKCCRSNGR